jgi:hypothetical protein
LLKIGGKPVMDEKKERFWEELVALKPKDGVFTRLPERKKK